ncbi:MAG: hypothetical protein K8S27_07785 [Candidatus Omnitrophica bacterium]|nr:hypothetical protein [Candidatus Omnitrophota bacterium]
MKKILIVSFLMLTFMVCPYNVWSQEVIALQDDIIRLKNDLRDGMIQIGKTRLQDVRLNYGDAPTITDEERKIIFDYGDLKVEFSKDRYLKDWRYDTFMDPAYTDSIDDLRKDLESQEIVGEFISLKQIKKDYDEPTQYEESDQDGEMSVYYYGDIKLTFENYFTLLKWRGKNLDKAAKEDLVTSNTLQAAGTE